MIFACLAIIRVNHMRLIYSCLIIFTIGLILSPAVLAADDSGVATGAMEKIDKIIPSDVNKSDDVAGVVGRAINILLGIIGTAALLVFLYSGIMWMTSGGNDKTITNAQKSMIWAGIGLFVIFFSYILVKYLITEMGTS